MGKNNKRESAEQLRAYRQKAEAERRAKEKKQDRILIGTLCGFLAVVLLAVGIPLTVNKIRNSPIKLGEPIVDTLEDAAAYTASAEKTDLVRLTVRYVDGKRQYRQGEIIVQLNAAQAPITVANFQKLVGEGFYNGLTFHRIASGFMIQGGDPEGNGTGGADEDIKGEFLANGVNNTISHKRGVISMARSTSYDSASSQFFIMHEDNTGLDGQYAAFGAVVSGMSTVDGIASTPVKWNDTKEEKSVPINPITLVKAEFVTKIG